MRRKEQNRIFRPVLPLLLALGILCSACGDSAKATTMQLMKIQGSVGILDGEGENISPMEEMRLYSGYDLTTRRNSFAWINLDNVKLTKMDAASEIEIRKNGRDLEILVKAGRMYFNVTEPLEEDENMNIRTSTMSVGIRGTCGWVEARDPDHMNVYILEGKVECSVTDPGTGQSKRMAVSGGETAQISLEGEMSIEVEPFAEEDVLPFVLEELAEDEELLDKIRESSGLDIRDFPDSGDPGNSVGQAMGDFDKTLGDTEAGSSLSSKMAAMTDEMLRPGPAVSSEGTKDSPMAPQKQLVENMLNGGEETALPWWLQLLAEAFKPKNLGSSLADGSAMEDYMLIRMGEGINCYKPNMYLYGEAGTTLDLTFGGPMLLTKTIPDYPDIWKVELAGDGTLIVNGEAGYPYLFYESMTIPGIFQKKEGFLVEAADREARFRKILEDYGLNRQEIQDFIEFWDAFLEKDADYVMYPQTTEAVDGAMPIEINGAELDNYFRLWFCFCKVEGAVPVFAQPLIQPASHEGTALVEWGGMVF